MLSYFPNFWTGHRFVDPESVFDSIGHERSEYIAKFHLEVADDVTAQVKVKIFLLSVIAGFAEAK